MTALPWLALAAALALVPLPSAAWHRAFGLSHRGRLAVIPSGTRRPVRLLPSPTSLRVAGGAGAAAGGFAVGGPALAAAAALLAATVAMLISAALARRHDSRRRRGLLAAIRLLVAELSAGSRPGAALDAAATAAPEHADAFRAAATSAAAGDAARALVAARCHELEPLAHAWRVAETCGAPLAGVLDRVATDLADQEQQQRSVTVALAGPRSSAVMLAGLPLVGIALGAAMGAHPLNFLLGTPHGRLICCAGAALDAAGVLWTQRLMQRALRP